MEYFVTTGRVEQEIAINELGYNEKTAPITGFARWDVLEDKQSDKESLFFLCLLGVLGLKKSAIINSL